MILRFSEYKATFNKLYEDYHLALCNYALAILKNKEEAEDVVQQMFIELWENRKKIDFDNKIKHLLFMATKRRCIDFLRKHKETPLYDAMQAVDETDIAPEQAAEKDELMETIYTAIAQLPEKTRRVFLLSRQNGLTYKEIAEDLGISVKTVENQMGRAFKILRKKLPAIFILFI